MKRFFLIVCLVFITSSLFGQREYHVFPSDHPHKPGKANASGSLEDPWDLATALSQSSDVVNGGDIVYLHEGIYNGRFISKLQSSISDKFITVRPYGNQKVIIDGNLVSKNNAVIQVKGARVIFRDLEITFKGEFPRREGESGFMVVNGIEHLSGEDCRFINLRIHNVPGTGFGSWKRTGGSTIAYCKVYNNGYFSKARGSGVGIYIQNQSEKQRRIHHNFIFNNYYKGIQVWSASSGAGFEYIKNVQLENNVIFNNGLPAGVHVDNLIIASDDRSGLNRPKNILVRKNVFFHNTTFTDGKNYGDGASLTIGYRPQAPVEDVKITDNIIIGKNNALRIFHAKSLEFKDNLVYCGYIHFNKAVLIQMKTGIWDFSLNRYHSRRPKVFRISGDADYTLNQWQDKMQLDKNSSWNLLKEFDVDPILYFSKVPNQNRRYELALFKKGGGELIVDLESFGISSSEGFILRNLETEQEIARGKITNGKLKIEIGQFNGTSVDFGVYSLEIIKSKKGKGGFFKRFFSWLF